MLPSQGYFNTINCPFYENNLCHRFYCHFRHSKKEPSCSSMINLSLNTENYPRDLMSQVFPQSVGDAGQRNSCNFGEESTKIMARNTQIKSQNIYLPPEGLPPYNPTPISKLQERNSNVIRERVEQVTKHNVDNLKFTKTIESIDLQNSVPANCLLESNDFSEHFVSRKINETDNSYSLCKQVDPEKSGLIQEKEDNSCNENYLCVDEINRHCRTENNQSTNDDATRQINPSFLLENQSSNVPEENDGNKTHNKKVIRSSVSIMDSINTGSRMSMENSNKINCYNSVNCKRACKSSTYKYGKIKLQESTLISSKIKTNSHNHHIKQKLHPRITSNITNEINLLRKEKEQIITISDSDDSEKCDEFDQFITRIQETQKLNQESNSLEYKNKINTEVESYDEFDEILKTIQEIKQFPPELEQKTEDESEKYDELYEIQRSVQEISQPTLEELPEPKKKIRKSHIKTKTLNNSRQISSQQKRNSQPHSSLDHKGVPQPKQKVRIAHSKAQHNTITMKSTKDYLSFWERVKERVKNKCANPSGEEGYQNWPQVKISPVLNVSSLLKSKKLLYAKINQWNCNKK